MPGPGRHVGSAVSAEPCVAACAPDGRLLEHELPGPDVPGDEAGLAIAEVELPETQQGVVVAARAKRFDLKIHAWTINDATEMEDLMKLGVDGIITDDPITLDQVRKLLGK